VVSLIALTAGWLFAVKFASRVYINPESESEESSPEELAARGPSAIKSVIPILLPIVLIVLRSVGNLEAQPFGVGNAAVFISFIGQPVVALLVGVFFALMLPKKLTTEMLSSSGWVGQAVVAAETIIIITGCGGAFGRVLQNSGISDVIEVYLGKARALAYGCLSS